MTGVQTCALPISTSAGIHHLDRPKANHALTFKLDQSTGADHQFAVIYREMGEDTLLTQINTHKIMEFVNELKRQGKANGTINRKMSALSKLLKHAKSLDLISELPTFPKFAEAKGRRRFLSKPEEEQLFSYAQRIGDRKSTRLNSSHKPISYAVFCLKKKTIFPPPPPLAPAA